MRTSRFRVGDRVFYRGRLWTVRRWHRSLPGGRHDRGGSPFWYDLKDEFGNMTILDEDDLLPGIDLAAVG